MLNAHNYWDLSKPGTLNEPIKFRRFYSMDRGNKNNFIRFYHQI